MLSAWVYQGWTLDSDRIRKYAIDTVYIDPRSANADAVIASLRRNGTTPGVYVTVGWPEVPTDPSPAAKWVSAQLERLIPRVGTAPTPPAMIELEGTTPSWQTSFLKTYRAYQPRRASSAAVAALQGGNVAAGAMMVAGFDLYVECYYGDMRPADAAACVLEQARAGDPRRVHPFYDGAVLPVDHRDGCVFTIERLPA